MKAFKNMSVLMILICVMAVMVGGCAGLKQNLSDYQGWIKDVNTPPAECEGSLIWENVPLPALQSTLITTGLAFYEANDGYRSWAISLHDQLIAMMDDPAATNDDLRGLLLGQFALINEYWGSKIILVDQGLVSMFTGDDPINVCDREWIKDLAKKRKAYLELFVSDTGEAAVLDDFFGGSMYLSSLAVSQSLSCGL